MNGSDEFILTKEADGKENGASDFDREEWARLKKAERERAYDLIDQEAMVVAASAPCLKDFLDVQSRFPEYSVGNALLLTAQMPNAARLGDFSYWKERGVHIQRGEVGIILLKPGKEYTKADGSTGLRIDARHFFDVSQTTLRSSGAPEKKRDIRALLKALTSQAPCEIRTDDAVSFPENRAAWYDSGTQLIYADKGKNPEVLFRELAEETVHALLDRGEYVREEHELTAYCASYVICARNGVPAGEFRYREIPDSFSSLGVKEIKAQLRTIRDLSGRICQGMDRCFEREAERSAEVER